jgi:hypothetical protein
MLSLPILSFSEFDLIYQLAKAIKGQVMSDLVTQHCGPEVAVAEPVLWTMFFNGSSCVVGAGIGIVLIHLMGQIMSFPS